MPKVTVGGGASNALAAAPDVIPAPVPAVTPEPAAAVEPPFGSESEPGTSDRPSAPLPLPAAAQKPGRGPAPGGDG